MSKPVILLDIDGVVANFIAGCLPHVLDLTGRLYEHDDVDQFMIEKALGLDAQQSKLLYDQVCKEGWVEGLPAYEEAKVSVAALREFADVVPVTQPFLASRHWVFERNAWILEHIGIDPRDVYHAFKKFRIHGDMLIDDRTSHLIEWAEYWTSKMGRGAGVAVRLRRRYNENEPWLRPHGSSEYPNAEWGVQVDDWAHLVRFARVHFGVEPLR
jgi:5'(3')-deoxyribonucleotidase